MNIFNIFIKKDDPNELKNKIDKIDNLVELHLHLDGALSIDSCRKLAAMQNIDIPKDENELKQLLIDEVIRVGYDDSEERFNKKIMNSNG